MKTRNIPVILLTASAVGCTDLDVDINSVYTEYPNSEIALAAKESDVYYAFRDALGRRFDEGNSFNSDEYLAISFGGDYLNSRDCANFSTRMIDPTNSDAQLDIYAVIASGITKCNPLIVEFGGDDAVASAPIRAIRAFYHFILMDHWGDVPILDHQLEEDEALERQPRADVARWIESELLAVRDKCTSEVTTVTYGRPTRWMVDALLAKLYINWNVYTQDVTSPAWSATATNPKLNDCIAACDDIIKSGLFDLSDDYKAKFFYNNGPHIKDFIYAMPYDASINGQDMRYARFRTWRKGDKQNGLYSVEMSKSVGGNYAINPVYSSLFCLDGDRRNSVIVGDANADQFEVYQYDVTTGEPTETPNLYKDESQVIVYKNVRLVRIDGDLDTGSDLFGWGQGYKSIKFFPNVDEYNTYDRKQSNDVPIFRYADVLLMKAEAIVRGGSATMGQSAQSLFNEIRTAANAPQLSGTPSLKDILDERGREFLDEHWRRNDLIRFGEFETCLSAKIFTNEKGEEFSILDINPRAAELTNRLWPLGQSVMNSNSNWKQNPGY